MKPRSLRTDREDTIDSSRQVGMTESTPRARKSIAPHASIIDFEYLRDNEVQQRSPAVDFSINLLERAAALLVLILTAPLLAIIALAIRIDSPGGAIFTQQRIGRNSPLRLRRRGAANSNGSETELQDDFDVPKTFTIYKFRTYRINSDALVKERASFDFGSEGIGQVYLQLRDDPRLTRIGRFLRRTSLDELPNLYNVVRGEMSIIGPRPEVIEMYRYYTLEQRDKFLVRPGVTGLAQVNGRGKLNFEQTLEFDLAYVRNRSLAQDLRILLRTVRVVVTGDGSF